MKKEHLAILIIILIIIAGGGAYWSTRQTAQAPVACTMEARLCPDGSYVGRTGPRCEFSPCPTATTTESGILPYDSGVRGKILLGPTCPVERFPPDPACADKPYQTPVTIFRASDPVHAFAIGKSDSDGSFSFALPPGNYTLDAGTSNLPRCDHPKFVVEPKVYTPVNISCDTGIR